MATTTVRLPEDLKVRIAAAAARAGTSAHQFILQAVEEKTEREERRADFEALAERRYADIVAGGATIPWDNMRAYLEGRLAGEQPAPPKARKRDR